MPESFEEALKVLADSSADNTLPDRDAVAGGSAEWFDNWNVAAHVIHNLSTNWDLWWKQNWTHVGVHYEIVVGLNLKKSWFDSSSNPWQQFYVGPKTILDSFTNSPWQTNEFSPHSFWYGGQMLQDLSKLLDTWNQNMTTWANDVNTSGSDFQGSAAGVFKHSLQTFAGLLDALSEQLAPQSITDQLFNVKDKTTDSVATLAQAFLDWHDNSANMPWNVANQQFQNVMGGAHISYHWSGAHMQPHISTSLGDPGDQRFWDSLENMSKSAWLATLVPLDNAAQTFLSNVDSAYRNASSVIPSTFVPPVVLAPPSTDPNSSGSNGNIPNLNSPHEFNSSGSGGGGGGGSHIPNVNVPDLSDFDIGGSGGKAGGGGGDGPLGSPKIGNNLLTGGSFDTGGTGGTGVGGQDTIDGPDGLPVLNASGLPLSVPPGSTINSQNHVIGPDGKPVLGPDGRPLTVPPNSRVAANTGKRSTRTGSDFDSGGTGGNAKPSGVETVDGPDGKPITGSSGLLTVPKGSRIGAGGQVFDAQGNPVMGPNGQPLKVPKGSTLSGTGGSSGDDDLHDADLLGSSGFGRSPSLGGLGLGGGAGGTGGGAGGLPKLLSTETGTSSRLKSLTGQEPGAESPGDGIGNGEFATAKVAAQESQSIGRVSTVGGTGAGSEESSMMPPMGGGMGGMTGGGGADGGSRKTWVTEDEEVWGTGTDTGFGVIGR
ncbi:hypothetical protein [Streptomyces sp. IBSBF 2435]|uniref:hypothetical protein n=1 Tax=Streptomyces sp. IBSBF 2435 TaxID=2903531 RepID=UPI002FDC3EEA